MAPSFFPLDVANHSLSSRVNMDMLDCHLLLALATMLVQCIEQCGIRAGQLIGLIEGLTRAFEGLLFQHGSAVTFHASVISSDQLRRHHAFKFIRRPYASLRGDSGSELGFVFVAWRVPSAKRLSRPISKNQVPLLDVRSTIQFVAFFLLKCFCRLNRLRFLFFHPLFSFRCLMDLRFSSQLLASWRRNMMLARPPVAPALGIDVIEIMTPVLFFARITEPERTSVHCSHALLFPVLLSALEPSLRI